ncbi:MAG: RnfABCDGE type electron transport complex subunit D [Erysipelotrichaceae bacterium]
MKFNFKSSPVMKDKSSTQKIMLDVTLCLLVVFGFTLYYYGTAFGAEYALRALLLMLTAIVTGVVVEMLWAKFYLKTNVLKFLNQSFPWVTSIILVLTCSITISYYAIIISTIAALVLGKLLFGGFGKNIFNPAGIGRAVVFASFLGVAVSDLATMATPTTTLASINWLILDSNVYQAFMSEFGSLPNLFLGFYPGAMGETFTLIILLCGVYLIIKKVIDWRIPVFYIGSVFVFTWLIAISQGMGMVNGIGLWYPIMHISIGGLAFGAVFMATDPVTTPVSNSGRVIFGVGLAFLTVLIRVKANLPEGVLFSILIMNMLVPMIDSWTCGNEVQLVKKGFIISSCLFLLGCVLFFFIGKGLEPTNLSLAQPSIIIEEVVEVNL